MIDPSNAGIFFIARPIFRLGYGRFRMPRNAPSVALGRPRPGGERDNVQSSDIGVHVHVLGRP